MPDGRHKQLCIAWVLPVKNISISRQYADAKIYIGIQYIDQEKISGFLSRLSQPISVYTPIS